MQNFKLVKHKIKVSVYSNLYTVKQEIILNEKIGKGLNRIYL